MNGSVGANGMEAGRTVSGWKRAGRLIRRLILGLVILVAILALSGSIYQAVASARDARRFPPPGRMVDVGGHRLHLNCAGEGSPTVVFDSPTGSSSLGWSLVQPEVATFTRACSYDRAGYAWSDPGPTPRTSDRIVSELQALLSGAGIEGPLVLAGSSIGGMHVQMLACRAPDRIAGMVLVDSVHHDQFSRLSEAKKISSAEMQTLNIFRGASRLGLLRLAGIAVGEGSAGVLPEDLRPAATAVGYRHEWIDAIYHEMTAIDESLAQARDVLARAPAPLLGDRPLIVLTHGKVEDESPQGLQDEKIWMELQKDLLRLSTAGAQTIAEKSGHFIQADRPDLVVDAIRQVVETSRRAAAGVTR